MKSVEGVPSGSCPVRRVYYEDIFGKGFRGLLMQLTLNVNGEYQGIRMFLGEVGKEGIN